MLKRLLVAGALWCALAATAEAYPQVQGPSGTDVAPSPVAETGLLSDGVTPCVIGTAGCLSADARVLLGTYSAPSSYVFSVTPLDSSGAQPLYSAAKPIKGSIAAGGAAFTDPPVPIGCPILATLPSYSTSTGNYCVIDTHGGLRVSLGFFNSSLNITGLPDNAYGQTATSNNQNPVVDSRGTEFNGTSWDLVTGNRDAGALIILTAAAAGTINSADQTNYNSRGVNVVFNMTTATSTSVVVNIQDKDSASGAYVTVCSTAAITTISTTMLSLYPGITATANVSCNAVLSRTWRVQTVITGGSSAATGTVGASVEQ